MSASTNMFKAALDAEPTRRNIRRKKLATMGEGKSRVNAFYSVTTKAVKFSTGRGKCKRTYQISLQDLFDALSGQKQFDWNQK